jgi:RHS repeat-associated protein
LPYGAPRSGAIGATERGWIGQTKDASTGLQYLNARYYDPTIGRFTAADPLANLAEPGSLDAYGYGRGSPVTLTDPTGLYACDDPRDCRPSTGLPAQPRKPPPAPPKVTTFWYLAPPDDPGWPDDVVLNEAAPEHVYPDGSGALQGLFNCAAYYEGVCERRFVTIEDELLEAWYRALEAIDAERPTIGEYIWDNRWNLVDAAVLATCVGGSVGSCVRATAVASGAKGVEIALSDRPAGQKAQDLLYTAIASSAYLLPGVASQAAPLVATCRAITLTQAPSTVVSALRIATAGPGAVCVAAGSQCTSPGIPTTG